MSDQRTLQQLTLARHYVDVGRPAEALQSLSNVEDDALQDTEYWELRTLALTDLERHEEAIEATSLGLALQPENPWLLYLRSYALTETGDLSRAEQAILEALRLDPENAVLISHYAGMSARAGQFDKAGKLLDEAARMAPEEAAVVRTRYLLATLQGKDREAEQHTEQWLANNPDDPDALVASGITRGARGRFQSGFDRMARGAAADIGVVQGSEALFRERKMTAHWLMLPMAPLQRFGPAKVWIAALAVIFGLNAAGQPELAGTAAIVYIAWCVYSWVVPPLLRKWYGL